MSTLVNRHGIVVGIDGSPASNAAVCWAARDAAMRHVPLTVVHMVNATVPMYPAIPLSTGVAVWQEEQGREVLEQAVKIAEDAVTTDRKIEITKRAEVRTAGADAGRNVQRGRDGRRRQQRARGGGPGFCWVR